MNQDILALAFEGHPIRTTNETPKRISVIDVLAAVGYGNPRDKWSEVANQFPEVVGKTDNLTFPGRGQRPTPVIDKQGILSLVMVLSGPKAAAFREWASSILVRYLDGDRSLAQEIHLRADLDEADELPAISPAEIFDEAAPGIMEVLADKALRGSTQAARLLLQYRNAIQVPGTPTHGAASALPPSLTPLQQFWRECLVSGHVTPSLPVGGTVSVRMMIRAFAAWAQVPVTRAMESSFGMQIRQLVPALRRRMITQGGERLWYYLLPSLTECRRLFAVATGVEVQS